MNILRKTILIAAMLTAFMPLAQATYVPFNTNVKMNVGIGTSTPQGSLVVLSGNVGIGTLSPIQALDVNGTLRATAFVGNGAGLTNINAASNWTYTSSGNVGLSTTAAVGIGTSFIGGANGAGLTVMNGNVGIGTWVPGALLNIGGGSPTTAVNGIQFGSDSNATLWRNASSSLRTNGALVVDSSVTAGNNSSMSLYLQGSNGTYASIGTNPAGNNLALGVVNGAAGGNVGIGTTTPVGGLAVMNGNVGIGTWVPADALDVNGQINSNSTINSGNLYMSGSASGLFYASTSDGGYSFLNGSGSNESLDLYSNSNGYIRFDTGVNNAMRIDSNGNVGIGSAAPGSVLDVQGTVRLLGVGNIGIDTVNPGQALDVQGTVRATNFVGSGTGLTGINAASNWTYTSSGNIGLSTTAAVGIGTSFIGGSGEGALSVMNGNVGIGTWVPKGTLDVGSTGTICLGGQCNSTWPAGGANWTYTSAGNIGLSTTAAVGIGTSFIGGVGEAKLAVINGNVGIGTWVPQAQLDVEGTLSFVSFGGNVGIGSLRPQTALDIVENAAANVVTVKNLNTTGYGGFDVHDSSGNLALQFGYGNSSASVAQLAGAGYLGTREAGQPLYFITGGLNYRMDIDGNGNVGIGTLTPVGGLAVMNGNVGIGTWVPRSYEEIVGIGTTVIGGGVDIMNGNVGIGTWVPGSALQVKNTMTFQSEYSNGNSGTSLTINWNNGNKQKVTLTGNCTFTFTAPTSGVTNLLLKLVQDATGSRTATWPAAVKWASATAPTLTTTAAQADFVTCYYDGTDYFCSSVLNFTP